MSADAPPIGVRKGHSKIRFYLGWLDAIRGPYLKSAAPFALGAVCAGSLGLGFGALDADPVAWMNGVAAIIVAVAALYEKRGMRTLEDRVLKLEAKAGA